MECPASRLGIVFSREDPTSASHEATWELCLSQF